MKTKPGLVDVPLFPLNVVLFPGQTLPLHIFEPRYRSMIERCVSEKSQFGVVLADEDTGEPSIIGTLAKITQLKRLPDGRMNILCVGTERFYLRDVRVGDDDYLLGNGALFPFQKTNRISREEKRQALRRLKLYLKRLAKVNQLEFQLDQLPRNTSELAVLTAIVLQVPLEDKQELLNTENVGDMLELEQRILQDEIFTLGLMEKAVPPVEEIGIFSRN